MKELVAETLMVGNVDSSFGENKKQKTVDLCDKDNIFLSWIFAFDFIRRLYFLAKMIYPK